MLEDVKIALRITTTDTDIENEIKDLIAAAKLDLNIAGISNEKLNSDEVDPLIKRAVIVYCKANHGYDVNEADRFAQSYLSLKQHLSLAGDYQ